MSGPPPPQSYGDAGLNATRTPANPPSSRASMASQSYTPAVSHPQMPARSSITANVAQQADKGKRKSLLSSIFRKGSKKQPQNTTSYASSSAAPSYTQPTAASPGTSTKEKRKSMFGFMKSATGASAEEIPTFTLRVDETLWSGCEKTSGNSEMAGTGSLFMDFTESLAHHWARGNYNGYEFGKPLFAAKQPVGLSGDALPPRLFDLVTNQLVSTAGMADINYAVMSHVWGPSVSQLDGKRFGIDWTIPIASWDKFSFILTAARIVVGERYIWMDVLCLDQRQRNETEIAKMNTYYANATGCFVYLDRSPDQVEWQNALTAIIDMNKFFNVDRFGAPTISVQRMMQGGLANLSMTEKEVMKFVKAIKAIERAPWFRRVWTLQEAVIPNNLYFVTPERYMTSGANLFQIIGLCELMANTLTDVGSMTGVAISHELQRSETFKILKLRQSYQRKEISYWHLVQAVRTRQCKYDQDRVFGVMGLLHGALPSVDYSRLTESIYQDLYRASIESGDLSALMFAGSKNILAPDPSISMGYFTTNSTQREETHKLKFTDQGIELQGVGYTDVTMSHCIYSDGELKDYATSAAHFLDLSDAMHVELALAFNLDPELLPGSTMCPAALAIYCALDSAGAEGKITKLFTPKCQEMIYDALPAAMLMWIKVMGLMQDRFDSALVVIWTSNAAEPQVAVVTERLQSAGRVVIITPSSYVSEPGSGCLICKVEQPGNRLKKIGVGLGKHIKAAATDTFLLT